MQTRLTPCFQSQSPVAQLDLIGLPRFPYPCEFVSLNLLHINVPLLFPVVAPSGFLLVNIEGDMSNLLTVNGRRYPYTWCLPFEPGALAGNFQWFTQAAAAGDDLFVTTRFAQSLRLNVSLVGLQGVLDFPPTPLDKTCSVEVAVRPK